jgi:hypothetical protein
MNEKFTNLTNLVQKKVIFIEIGCCFEIASANQEIQTTLKEKMKN